MGLSGSVRVVSIMELGRRYIIVINGDAIMRSGVSGLWLLYVGVSGDMRNWLNGKKISADEGCTASA